MGEASGDHDSDDDGSSSAVQDAHAPCDFASEADDSALRRRALKNGTLKRATEYLRTLAADRKPCPGLGGKCVQDESIKAASQSIDKAIPDAMFLG